MRLSPATTTAAAAAAVASASVNWLSWLVTTTSSTCTNTISTARGGFVVTSVGSMAFASSDGQALSTSVPSVNRVYMYVRPVVSVGSMYGTPHAMGHAGAIPARRSAVTVDDVLVDASVTWHI